MSMVSLTVLMIATFDEGTDLLPVKAFVGFAAVAVMMVLMVMCYVELTTISNHVVSMRAEAETLQTRS